MYTQSIRSKIGLRSDTQHPAVWLWLSIVAVLLAIAGSILALTNSRIYGSLTPSLSAASPSSLSEREKRIE